MPQDSIKLKVSWQVRKTIHNFEGKFRRDSKKLERNVSKFIYKEQKLKLVVRKWATRIERIEKLEASCPE